MLTPLLSLPVSSPVYTLILSPSFSTSPKLSTSPSSSSSFASASVWSLFSFLVFLVVEFRTFRRPILLLLRRRRLRLVRLSSHYQLPFLRSLVVIEVVVLVVEAVILSIGTTEHDSGLPLMNYCEIGAYGAIRRSHCCLLNLRRAAYRSLSLS